MFSGSIFHKFVLSFIMDSVAKKTVNEFLVGRWTPLVSNIEAIYDDGPKTD